MLCRRLPCGLRFIASGPRRGPDELLARGKETNITAPTSTSISSEEAWRRRERLAKPTIQRFEPPLPQKAYWAPEWDIDQAEEDEEYNPLKKYGITPEKWEYYNKAGYGHMDILLLLIWWFRLCGLRATLYRRRGFQKRRRYSTAGSPSTTV